jgi:aldose 1-epimerase
VSKQRLKEHVLKPTISEQDLTPIVLQNEAGLRVEILPYGATLWSIQLDGQELTLQHPSRADYVENPGYLGSTIGRYANRLASGRLLFEQQVLQLTANGEHCLHGGEGFSHRVWQVQRQQPDQVLLFLYSAEGESGFPGDLSVWQEITLQETTVSLSFRATTHSTTVVSLTNHCYFNLDQSADIGGHQLQILADQFLPVDAGLIPTGERQPVANSVFDFRQPQLLSAALASPDPQLALAGGFDHCYVFASSAATLHNMAVLTSPRKDLQLTVRSTLPGLQFYAGHGLTPPHHPHQALCLEAQFWPDAPNRADFPATLLRAGELWQHQIQYQFTKGVVVAD